MTTPDRPDGEGETGRALDDVTLRRWLLHLRQPDRLAEPALVALLEERGLRPDRDGDIGEVAAAFLTQSIERLRPATDGPERDDRPYLVLKACFLEGAKLKTAATRLGMSPRQLSRERTRALALLRRQLLESRPTVQPSYRYPPIPAILDFLERPTERQLLSDTLRHHNVLHVHGPAGIGKTCLVADFAAGAQHTRPVIWHRFRPRINDSLLSVLFELGDFLAGVGMPTLAAQLATSLPSPDPGLMSRVALKDLADVPLLLVLDDYQVVDGDEAFPGFLAEAALRCPQLRVVTVGRHRPAPSETEGSIAVPPLSRRETESLFERLGVPVESTLGQTLHRWTGGTPQLIRLTASWMKSASPEEVASGTSTLENLEEVQDFLLDSITELLGSEDRAVLAAASTFRDRFTDDALAWVAHRTRGHVQDASRRLVRYYVAVRSRSGDVAFLHASVRNYVHGRLAAPEHAELHERAAEWYERAGNPTEAEYHRKHGRLTPPTH